MNSTQLTNFYDELKAKLDQDNTSTDTSIKVGGGPTNGVMEHPGVLTFRRKAAAEGDKLRENCRKHIILDIYCKMLPLDDDYKCDHMRQMKNDIDCMLQGKNVSATQYLTSCFEATEAPLVEYILRATDMIRDQYMEKTNEELQDAISHDINIAEPKAPDIDSKEVQEQLVDIEKDTEYSSFIEKLKNKTVNKIVADVSKIINGKKEEKDMTFDTNPADELKNESAVSISLDYITKQLMTESVDVTPEVQDKMIGMAIRESVLNEMDNIFGITESNNNFMTRIKLGKGFVCNESTIADLSSN